MARKQTIPEEIDQFLDLYPLGVKEAALAARDLVMRTLPDATESLDRTARVIGYGYGPGYKDTICTLILSKAGVKLGVARGASIADPAGLLAGSGKVHRHVDLRPPELIKNPELESLLKTALAAWKAAARGRTGRN
jgi:hypothetical protein